MNSIQKALIVLIYTLLFSCSPTDVKHEETPDTAIDLELIEKNNWDLSNAILFLINEHRESLGKNTLTKDTSYATACAVHHSMYMKTTESVNHNNFFIRSNALKAKGATKVSENVAYAFTSAKSVVSAWLRSDGHRKTIEGDFTHIGFGIVKSENNKYYYTTLFYK